MTFPAFAATDSAAVGHEYPPVGNVHKKVIITGSLGFVDYYRNFYSLPGGFVKGNTSGFSPFYLRAEYGISEKIGLGASFCYDAFNYNFRQKFTGNNGTIFRYGTNNARILSGGITAYYHLSGIIRIRHLDPFVGVGLVLNNIRYGSYPQGDSTLTVYDHTLTPYLKVGARYYISARFSLFADAGYDQQSIFSIGASCRFLPRQRKK